MSNKRRTDRSYFGDPDVNDLVYGEIEDALRRIKDSLIEEAIMGDETKKVNLFDAVDKVADILEDYSVMQRIFKSIIYDGTVPEDLLGGDDPEQDDFGGEFVDDQDDEPEEDGEELEEAEEDQE